MCEIDMVTASLKPQIPEEPAWILLLILLPQSIIASTFNLCSSFTYGNRNSPPSAASFVRLWILGFTHLLLSNPWFNRFSPAKVFISEPRISNCIFESLLRSLRTAAFVLLWRWLFYYYFFFFFCFCSFVIWFDTCGW